MLGRVVAGRYRLEARAGEGGMGVVYRARHLKLNRIVALKMILSGSHAGEAEQARFRTEAEAVARLQHPNVVQVFEVGGSEGVTFLALEFCPGGSLDRKLAGTPTPPREAAALVKQVAEAMQAAHNARVVHRDLKPANVLIQADGTPKVTDFGLAKKLDEQGQTIPRLDPRDIRALVRTGTASAGMVAKLTACEAAARAGVREVMIVDGRDPKRLEHMLASLRDSAAAGGTRVTR